MKRIISAVAVVAIVSSALAFAPKKGGAYCASQIRNVNCGVVTNVTEAGGTTIFFKDPNWNGTVAGCNPNNCPVQTLFKAE